MKKWLLLLIFSLFLQPLQSEENFLLIDGSTSRVIREFGANINERVTPASSFKIVLSLIGYDAGILKDANTPIWDFQEGYDDWLEAWRSPHMPRTWIEHSCLWFSKLIAMELGLEKFQDYLDLLEYGNLDLSSGLVEPGSSNPAWVSSSLKISPKEQVDFLQKMLFGILPVSRHAVEMTKSILFKDELFEDYKLCGKTGLGSALMENGENLQVRWFVGWVEKDQTYFPFAYQMRAKEIDTNQTIPRVKQLLKESITHY